MGALSLPFPSAAGLLYAAILESLSMPTARVHAAITRSLTRSRACSQSFAQAHVVVGFVKVAVCPFSELVPHHVSAGIEDPSWSHVAIVSLKMSDFAPTKSKGQAPSRSAYTWAYA
ncbi:hypothetical protein BC826DRAFT_974237 [Russula brevipes]|nr:hypothetical protein BC826DRAFT_974237 [Russula brevipes]